MIESGHKKIYNLFEKIIWWCEIIYITFASAFEERRQSIENKKSQIFLNKRELSIQKHSCLYC